MGTSHTKSFYVHFHLNHLGTSCSSCAPCNPHTPSCPFLPSPITPSPSFPHPTALSFPHHSSTFLPLSHPLLRPFPFIPPPPPEGTENEVHRLWPPTQRGSQKGRAIIKGCACVYLFICTPLPPPVKKEKKKLIVLMFIIRHSATLNFRYVIYCKWHIPSCVYPEGI